MLLLTMLAMSAPVRTDPPDVSVRRLQGTVRHIQEFKVSDALTASHQAPPGPRFRIAWVAGRFLHPSNCPALGTILLMKSRLLFGLAVLTLSASSYADSANS